MHKANQNFVFSATFFRLGEGDNSKLYSVECGVRCLGTYVKQLERFFFFLL